MVSTPLPAKNNAGFAMIMFEKLQWKKLWQSIKIKSMFTQSLITYAVFLHFTPDVNEIISAAVKSIAEATCRDFSCITFRKRKIVLVNLTRIKNIENTNQTFDLPDDFDFATRCGGGRFGAFKEANKVHYEIDFYDDARQFIKECVWADDQEFIDYEEDCTTTIKFSSSQSLKVLEWVLSQGANARPRAPEEFVERWKKEIHAFTRIL